MAAFFSSGKENEKHQSYYSAKCECIYTIYYFPVHIDGGGAAMTDPLGATQA